MRPRQITLIGERDLAKRAHQGIEASLALFRRDIDPQLNFAWVDTASLTPGSVDAVLKDSTGIWCVPGSPYASTEGALLGIRHARTNRKAFLGTCGGFQHALMEFAQDVLGRPAEHAEMNSAAREPLIAKLSCSLVGATGRIIATDVERFAALLGAPESVEEFHCNYGFNGDFAGIFHGSALKFVAHDETGQMRAFRLDQHPFFVGTLFQPERRSLQGSLHPLVRAFLEAAAPPA
jgi:CTP synthase (UTP-ammonia lyase)